MSCALQELEQRQPGGRRDAERDVQRCLRAGQRIVILAARQIEDVAGLHVGFEQQPPATRREPLFDFVAGRQRRYGRIRARLVDAPGLLAFHLQREYVVQIEVRLERLHSLEGAIDVRGNARGELAFEHVDDRRDFRADAMDVIRDQAGAERPAAP